jgi:three-Cys-motif partner protein
MNASVAVDPLAGLSRKKYEIDEDGYPREIVRVWANEKHQRLCRYVDISRKVRNKFSGPGKPGATYIDLCCGPGRVIVKDTNEVTHGSPMWAWTESVRGGHPFTELYIADAKQKLVDAAHARLTRQGAKVIADHGPAAMTVGPIVKQLDPSALHFAFLDPFNLESLPFSVLERLASLERMDMLIHVSLMDLQRNLRAYIAREDTPLDAFAPHWRDKVDIAQHDDIVRGQIFHHWVDLLRTLDMTVADGVELVSATGNQPLYWLAFTARHDRALEFWEKIRKLDSQHLLL